MEEKNILAFLLARNQPNLISKVERQRGIRQHVNNQARGTMVQKKWRTHRRRRISSLLMECVHLCPVLNVDPRHKLRRRHIVSHSNFP